jgi:hypothetical protein
VGDAHPGAERLSPRDLPAALEPSEAAALCLGSSQDTASVCKIDKRVAVTPA